MRPRRVRVWRVIGVAQVTGQAQRMGISPGLVMVSIGARGATPWTLPPGTPLDELRGKLGAQIRRCHASRLQLELKFRTGHELEPLLGIRKGGAREIQRALQPPPPPPPARPTASADDSRVAQSESRRAEVTRIRRTTDRSRRSASLPPARAPPGAESPWA